MTHFVHRKGSEEETIAAIATPPGVGGVAIIRISGKQALEIGAKVFSGPLLSYVSHTAHMGKILSSEGTTIDAVLALVMRAPRSYTGENTVEFHCHGGTLVTQAVLKRVLEAGARAANPGEFTYRAFLNGKLDLAQAEAVQEMIHAKNSLAASQAFLQLEGSLSKKISNFQKRLTDTAAILEAWVDFPEEGLEFATTEEILKTLEEITHEIDLLEKTFDDGKKLSLGISLCLAGPPNVGKSSLMNALLRKERAIVTPIAGTTRDLLEEDLQIGSLHFRLIDTAGIRTTEEVIEKEGISRSLKAIEQADLILLVLDGSMCENPQNLPFLKSCPPEKTLLIWNKVDLGKAPQNLSLPYQVDLSAKTEQGFDLLLSTLNEMLWKEGVPSKEEVIVTKMRHHQALVSAKQALQTVSLGLKSGVSAEFITADLKAALMELGTIIGTDITEDILTAIFSKFCVGK